MRIYVHAIVVIVVFVLFGIQTIGGSKLRFAFVLISLPLLVQSPLFFETDPYIGYTFNLRAVDKTETLNTQHWGIFTIFMISE